MNIPIIERDIFFEVVTIVAAPSSDNSEDDDSYEIARSDLDYSLDESTDNPVHSTTFDVVSAFARSKRRDLR